MNNISGESNSLINHLNDLYKKCNKKNSCVENFKLIKTEDLHIKENEDIKIRNLNNSDLETLNSKLALKASLNKLFLNSI